MPKIVLKFIFPIILFLISVLSLMTNWYTWLVWSLVVVLTIMMIDKMGKGIVLRESTAMLYAITCLLMPLMGYAYYSISNPLSRLWFKYMPIPEDVYFNFALPAISFFCFSITFPLGLKRAYDEGETLTAFIQRIKHTLLYYKNQGFYIIIVGVLFSVVTNYMPAGLQYFVVLFFFASFAGLLYVYFAPAFKYKLAAIIGFGFFILLNALNTGMFTIVAYMGVTIYSFFMIGKRTSFVRKSLILLLAIGFVIVLQNTKLTYRQSTWLGGYSGNKGELFGTLFFENLRKGNALITEEAFFPIYSRTNQGFNVALVMKRFPSKKSYDYGSNLMLSIASAFVPRFLWPDKPEAGGKANMKYYTGITIRGWSTNVGSLGEAYGSFGVTGGIIYMFLLGAFIRWAYQIVFILSKSIPLVICWIPVLFYQITYSAETDTLQIFNSLFKTAFFIFILYKLLPAWFGKSTNLEQRLYQKSKITAPRLN